MKYRFCFLERGIEHKTLSLLEDVAKLGNIIDGWKITAVGVVDKKKELSLSRVVILCAGKGSRLGKRTLHLNKALLKVGNKAVISHTIDSFPKETEFVIALGYRGDIVRQYLEISYPERNFIFVEVDKIEGEGSGPGYSLRKCKEYLQCPFYYVSCDAIIGWEIVKSIRIDWAAYSKIDIKDTDKYCTIRNTSAHIEWVLNKSKHGTDNAFVGVAFIDRYEDFWKCMNEEKSTTVEDEIQVAPVILKMKDMAAVEVDWYDTGSEEGIQRARAHFQGLQNLDKADEEIYFVNGAAVKYFYNDSSIKGRLARTELLGNSVPKLLGSTRNFYKYEFIEGKDLSTLDNQHEIIISLLEFSKKCLWKNIELSSAVEKAIFEKCCKIFYYDKTLMRLNKFYDISNIIEQENIIDGQIVPKIEEIFKLIDWDWLSDGFPCIGHGDLNLSNVLLLSNNSFKLIDFRQDFGGSVDKFDAYYDLAKLYCSFLLPRQSANNNRFSFSDKNGLIETSIEIPDSFQKAKELFERWVIDEGWDLKKIKVLTEIIFINMAPLHEKPLDRYLFYFAKQNLYSLVK